MIAHLEGPCPLNLLLTGRKQIGKNNPSGSCYLLRTLSPTQILIKALGFLSRFPAFLTVFKIIFISISNKNFLDAQVTFNKIFKSMLNQYSNTLQ